MNQSLICRVGCNRLKRRKVLTAPRYGGGTSPSKVYATMNNRAEFVRREESRVIAESWLKSAEKTDGGPLWPPSVVGGRVLARLSSRYNDELDAAVAELSFFGVIGGDWPGITISFG